MNVADQIMFCPKCRTEYRDGFIECTDCKVPLVEKLPLEPEAEWVDLVTVLTTINASTVALAKSMLEEAGIKHIATGELSKQMFAIGTVRIQVSKDDEETARELLEGIEGKESDKGAAEDIE